MNKKVGIIGIGNMGSAFVDGLVKGKVVSSSHVIIFDADTRRMRKWKVKKASSVRDLAGQADIIILAVKPYQMDAVLKEAALAGEKKKLFVSIAAGYPVSRMQKILERDAKLIRLMPNTPCKVGKGIIGLYSAEGVTRVDIKTIQDICQPLGKVIVLKTEKQIDAITAISGSGPAYFYYFAEGLEQAARKLGFNEEVARKLAVSTMIGSAELLESAQQTPKSLRQAVTSKRGTTEAAIKSFEKDRLFRIVEKAVYGAFKRAGEIAKGK